MHLPFCISATPFPTFKETVCCRSGDDYLVRAQFLSPSPAALPLASKGENCWLLELGVVFAYAVSAVTFHKGDETACCRRGMIAVIYGQQKREAVFKTTSLILLFTPQ